MNKQQPVGALLIGLPSLSSASALADEQAIELKDGPGRDVVETNCGIRHSLVHPDELALSGRKIVASRGCEDD